MRIVDFLPLSLSPPLPLPPSPRLLVSPSRPPLLIARWKYLSRNVHVAAKLVACRHLASNRIRSSSVEGKEVRCISEDRKNSGSPKSRGSAPGDRLGEVSGCDFSRLELYGITCDLIEMILNGSFIDFFLTLKTSGPKNTVFLSQSLSVTGKISISVGTPDSLRSYVRSLAGTQTQQC